MRRRLWGWGAALLVGAALFGGAPRAAEAQLTGARKAAALAEAKQLLAEVDRLDQAGNYDAALPLAERVLSLREKALGPDHPSVADALNSLAVLHMEKGSFSRAEPLFERALAIWQKAVGPGHPGVAQALHNLATLYVNMADYARAASSFQRALTILEAALGPKDPQVAQTLNSLGYLYFTTGDFARAEPLHQRALAIFEATLGPEDPMVARSLTGLGNIYFEQGLLARAEPLHLRAMAIDDAALGPDHPETAGAIANVANVYMTKGDYARAEPLHQRALAIFEKALGPDHAYVGQSLQCLANLYDKEGDRARAEPLFRRAIATYEKALGPEHPSVAHALNDLAVLYEKSRAFARAEPLFERALAIREKALGSEHFRVAESLHSLAYLRWKRADHAGAEPLFQRALAVYTKALGPTHPHVAELLYGLAILDEAREDYPHAVAMARRAAEVSETNLALIIADDAEPQKRAYLAMVAGEVDHDVGLAVHARGREAAELALTSLLRRKGRALDATADSMRLLRARLGAGEQRMFDDLLAVRSQRSTLTLRGPDAAPIEVYRKLLADLEEQDRKLEADISARSAAFRAEAQPITVAAVKAALPQGSVLVEWSVYEPFSARAQAPQVTSKPRYAACVLPQHGEPACVDLGEAAPIDAAVAELRKALSRAAGERVKELARALDALAMAPVRKLLGETRRVFLSPDGALNLLPFAALVDEDHRYLVESYAFTYLTSGRDLLRLQDTSARPRQEEAAVLAFPDFDASGLASPPSGARAGGERGAPSLDLAKMSFKALPGTASEAQRVTGALGSARVLVGAEATEKAFKALHGPRLLHVATHGFFLPDQPAPRALLPVKLDAAPSAAAPLLVEDPLLRSGLAFAGANRRRSGADDGLLTAMEVSGTDLYGTSLVVLSACDTGVGEVVNADGVYGLRRALVLAGARTQVMSLWKVDDAPTEELMTAYYQRLGQGEGKSEAIRNVQLAMLAQPDRAAPYYWASFIVSGDDRTLAGRAVTPDLRVHPGGACACALGGEAKARGVAWLAGAAAALALARRRARRGLGLQVEAFRR